MLPFAIGVGGGDVDGGKTLDGSNGPDDMVVFVDSGGVDSKATEDLLDVVRGGENAVGGGAKIPGFVIDSEEGLSSRFTELGPIELAADPSPRTVFT